MSEVSGAALGTFLFWQPGELAQIGNGAAAAMFPIFDSLKVTGYLNILLS